jgi:hypothetical protein
MALRQYLFNKFQSVVPSLVNGQSWPTIIDTTGALSVNTEGRKATYRSGLSGFTPPVGGIVNGPFFSLQGSPAKVVRLTRIRFSATAATGASADLQVFRYSSLSGGTGNSAFVSLDINNPTPSATATGWATAPTSATRAGTSPLAADQYEIVTTSVSVQPQVIEWTFGNYFSQTGVIRGLNDYIGVTINNVGTTPLASVWFEWTEE